MAGTIDEQVKKLEEAHSDLSRRVQERTAELSNANRRLQKEAEDRIRSDQLRTQLESRLRRAERMEAMGAIAGGVAHEMKSFHTAFFRADDIICEWAVVSCET
jgi:C4-dicarboxylate-specific signal transduction histidine kinase